MAYQFKTSFFKPRYLPKVEWIDKPKRTPEEFRRLTDSLPYNPMDFPNRYNPYLNGTKAKVKSKHKELPDIFPGPGPFNCSPRFKDLVEELEPGIHEFINFEILMQNGEPVEGGYFHFNVLQVLDAIIPEKSTIEYGMSALGKETWIITEPTVSEKFTFDQSVINGKHLWWDTKMGIRQVYCSDTFQNEFQNRGMKFLEFKKHEEE